MSQITDEAFDKIMGANVRSNHTLCNLVIPEMVERKDGSDHHRVVDRRSARLAGARRLLHFEGGRLPARAQHRVSNTGVHNVRANCIAPGLIKTDFAKALVGQSGDPRSARPRARRLKRIGEADEIAGAAVFLASKAAAFMTGQTMVIDGGATI